LSAPDAVLGGLWEFPGGKCQPDETLAQCACREATEELGITIACTRPLEPITYDYPHGRVSLHPFIARHISGDPQALGVQTFQWITPVQLAAFSFPPANAPLLALLAKDFSILL